MPSTALLRAPAPTARPAGRGRTSRLVIVAVAQPSKAARTAARRPAQPAPTQPRAALADAAASVAAALLDEPPLDELKAMLLDSLFGTERGLSASSEVGAGLDLFS